MKRLLTLLFALVISVASGLSVASPASAQEYFCGKQCNGKSPHWVIPSNGIQCYKSATVVKHGTYYGNSADYRSGVDPQMHFKVYYSKVCQTLWFKVTNNHPASLKVKQCTLEIYNKDWHGGVGGHSGMYRPACPKPGHTVVSKMVNDHSPRHKVYAWGGGFERLSTPRRYYKVFDSGFDFRY